MSRRQTRRPRRRREETEAERAAEAAKTAAEIDDLFAMFAVRFLPGTPLAAIYARYSTEFQHSVIDQVRVCLEEALRGGFRVLREHVFFDLAISGSKSRRSGLDALRKEAAKKGFGTLLALTTNRLFRKQYKCVQFVEEELVERGLRGIFVKTNIDTADTLRWKMLLQMYAMIDEQGTVMYAANIRAAHEGMFEKGWVVSSLPFGYCGESIDGPPTKRQRPRQKIAINADEAGWVRRIFHWFVTDRLPMARILERLNSENAPLPPKAFGGYWTHAALRYLLENPAYRGWWSYGKGQNVWQSKADYSKRVIRETPLREKQFDHLRIIDEEIWHRAQKLLTEHPARAGRKPIDGDRKTRPRVLNGLLVCEAHGCKLKVCGDKGQWMCCLVCRTLPTDVRPLHSYLSRELATRLICEAVARLIRQDNKLSCRIMEAAEAAVARAGTPDQGRRRDLQARLDRANSRIRFVMDNPGDAEEDHRESQAKLRALRQERAVLQAELTQMELAEAGAVMPGEAEIQEAIDELDVILGSVRAAGDETTAGLLRAVLELVTGGVILVDQMGEKRRFKGWLRGRFCPRLLELVASRLPDGLKANLGSVSETPIMEVEFREDIRIAEMMANRVKELSEEGHLYTRIAEMLGIERHQVADALRIWHERHGLPVPQDGRQRRGEVPEGNMKPSKAMLLAGKAKALFDLGLLIDQIAERLKADRTTIRSALRIAFGQLGEPMPDGRNRRKTLEVKNRPKAGGNENGPS